jgi:hypothetical protein
MIGLRTYLILTLLLGCAWLTSAVEARACSAPSPPSARSFVISAETIVRATAVEQVKDQGVKFQVEEVLKGENVPQTLIFTGSLSERDDYNDRPVPYDFVRREGRGGMCFAYRYKQGAQFLLFLKKLEGKLTPYWIPFAPSNEQLRSADDPWVLWIKDHLKWAENASELERLQLTFDELKRGDFKADAGLLWGYRFSDPDEEKLRRLAMHLETLGYRLADLSRSKGEAAAEGYTLRVEKVESHTPATMLQRNRQFRALATAFDIRSYDMWVVSRVK